VRSIVAAIGFCLINLATGPAYGQAVTEPANAIKPRVYALVAAVGEQFSFVSEVQSTGSHLSPYRRRIVEVPDNILNRLALHGLDKAIANIDPDSKRIYMALPAAQMAGIALSDREGVAISKIVSELEKMPQRLEWDRIVIATPAYRALELNGLASRLQGFGLFSQPLCQGRCGDDLHQLGQDGVDAVTSEDKTIRARTYIAPFSYIEVWVLDPKSMAILDKRRGFDSQKPADPSYKPLDLSQSVGQKYVAGRISSLIELSFGEAVMHSELNRRGKVEVGEPKVVNPDDAKK
jgi:hypothetical protein